MSRAVPLAAFLLACGPAPDAPTVRIEPAEPTTLDTLTAVLDAEDTRAFVITWKRDGAIVADADGVEVDPELTARGQVWSVAVAVDLGDEAGTPGTAQTTIVNAPPTGTVTLSPEDPSALDEVLATPVGEDPDGDSLTWRWRWLADGTEIAGADADRIVPEGLGRGSVLEVRATPFDGEDEGTEATAQLTLGNSPPVIRSVAILPDPPTRAGPLRAEVDAYDPDGDDLTLTYAWTIDGEDGGVSEVVPADRVYRGSQVGLTVVANDGEDDSAPKSAAVVFVRNAAPTVAEARLTPTSGDETTVFGCEAVGVVDADGDDVELLYTWLVEGVPVPGATGDTLDGASFDRGDRVACEIAADDLDDVGPAVRSGEVVIANALPRVTSASIATNSPRPGQPLTLTLSVTDPDGDAVELDYAWSVEGAVVGFDAELPAARYSEGDDVTCRITPSDPFGTGTPYDTPVIRIANAIPEVTGVTFQPAVPNAGEDLRAVVTAIDAEGDPFNLQYTWEVEGTAVAGITGDVLPKEFLTRGDGVRLTVVVSDASGTAPPWRSDEVIVGNAKPAVSTVRITPTPLTRAGNATCVPSGWTDPDGDPPGYIYAWIVNGSAATVSSATLSAANFRKGDRVRCTAVPDDGFDTGSLVSSTTLTVANAPPSAGTVTLSPVSPREVDVITATVGGLSDPDPEDAGNLSATVSWVVNDTPVPGYVGTTLNGSAFNRGDLVRAVATPTDGAGGAGAPLSSEAVTVRNTAPVIDAVSISPTSPGTADTLTAVVDVRDSDPIDVPRLTFSYRWRVDGFTVQESALGTLSGSFFSRGQEVEVSVVASDGTDSSARRSSSKVLVVNAPPSAPGVRVTPRWSRAGARDLRCELVVPSVDGDNDLPTYSFTWLRNGQPYPEAGDTGPTRTTYDGDTVPVADLGTDEVWTCRATASDGAVSGPPGTATGRTAALDLIGLSSGTRFSCGIDLDGDARCWGLNETGQAVAPDALGVQAIATGGGSACAVTDSNTLRCWGNLTTSPAGSTWTDVGVGALHACARNRIGTVACWGQDTSGSTSPPAGTYKRLAVGAAHACALGADGTASCWGSNTAGQRQPPAGVKFLEIAAGSEFTCGLKPDGEVQCWGAPALANPPPGPWEELRAGAFQACVVDADDQAACWGDGTFADLDVPPGDYAELAPGTTHTCASRTDGSMVCWGTEDDGEAAPPVTAHEQVAPGEFAICAIVSGQRAVSCWGDDVFGQASPPLLLSVDQVVVSPTHACARLLNGTLRCWGDDTAGKATAPSGATWAQVDVGSGHSCAVDTLGAITCWGDDTFGQSSGPFTGGPWKKVAVGDAHTCALSTAGSLECWGASTANRLAHPTIGTFLDLDASALNTCAVKNDTTITCWGDNQKGQGNPTVLPTWTRLTMGDFHGCAWSPAGTTTCWGDATWGATTVPTTTGFERLDAGVGVTCGLRLDGRSSCWGRIAH